MEKEIHKRCRIISSTVLQQFGHCRTQTDVRRRSTMDIQLSESITRFATTAMDEIREHNRKFQSTNTNKYDKKSRNSLSDTVQLENPSE